MNPAKPVIVELATKGGTFLMACETAAKLEPHPLALLYPPLNKDDLDSLAKDILHNGQLDAIVLYENKILDGLHRNKACVKHSLDVKCIRFEDLDYKGTHVDFVFSANSERRHVDKRTLALIKAGLLNFKEIERERANKISHTKQHVAELQPHVQKHVARDKIRTETGVTQLEAQQAINIAKYAPELVPQVTQHKVTFEKAAEEAKQRAPVHKPTRSPAQPSKPEAKYNLDKAVIKAVTTMREWLRECPPARRPEFRSQVVKTIKLDADPFLQKIRQEIKRRRKEMQAPRIKGTWNVDAVSKFELAKLLDWIEDELNTIPG